MGPYYFPQVLFFLFFFALCLNSGRATCGKKHRLVGFQADLSMDQHQLRGTIDVLDDCTFQVTNLDMLAGPQVYWWGATGEDMEAMLAGQRLSSQPLVGNISSGQTEVTLFGLTWDDIRVLAVWSEAMYSSYGHVVLEPAGGWAAWLATQQTVPQPSSSDATCITPLPTGTVSPVPTGSGTAGGAQNGSDGGSVTASTTTATEPVCIPGNSSAPGAVAPPALRGAGVPTMLDSCLELSSWRMRVRWSVDAARGTVDVATEASLREGEYMAFGWAAPNTSNTMMLEADVVVAGYGSQGEPFALDYFITDYTPCQAANGRVAGVCPDSVLQAAQNLSAPGNTSNVELIYAQQMDGITFIRWRRRLATEDQSFDQMVDPAREQPVVWAIGQFRDAAPEENVGLVVPLYHGGEKGSTRVAIGQAFDTCMGPLVKQGGTGLILSKKHASLLVGVGNATRYPNPPNEGRSLYINGMESPELQVERGVAVNFTVMAGAGFPIYLTDTPLGGGAGAVLAGGPDTTGTPAIPYYLTWTPNHTTPPLVYYQAWSQKKMGWKVHVVDGGLADMYPNFTPLADGKVLLYWALHFDSISFAVRSTRPCGWLAIAFGDGMLKSNAYVGWLDGEVPRVATYWMDAHYAAGVHPTKEMLTNTKVAVSGRYITFEFTRLLHIPGSRNVIEPEVPLRVVWAYGERWTSGALASANMHFATSSDVTLVNLQAGTAKVEHLQPVLVVHGSMMFLAWGMLLPAGILVARYLKTLHVGGDEWFKFHIYAQYTGLAVAGLGLLFAMGELKGLSLHTMHARLGLVAIILGTLQPINACFRPPKPAPGDKSEGRRLYWEWVHKYTGRLLMLLSTVTLFTGVVQLGKRDEMQHHQVGVLLAGLVSWLGLLIGLTVWLERRKRLHLWPTTGLSHIMPWANGVDGVASGGEDAVEGDSLIQPLTEHTSEIQLQPLHR